MNNINQKNVIYSLQQNSELPYSDIGYANHYSGRELNAPVVNTSMQQLLDNDLYIENMLNATSAYMVGPKAYNESTISAMPNGYKAYGSIDTADCLDILRKSEKPLSSSIVSIPTFSNKDVKFICQFGNLILVGAENQKLKYKESSSPVSDEVWREFPLTAVNYYADDTRLFFAANDGVYQLSTYIILDDTDKESYGKKRYSVVKLNKNNLKNITAVSFSKKKNLLFAAVGGEVIESGDNKEDVDAKIYFTQYDIRKPLDALKDNLQFKVSRMYDPSDDKYKMLKHIHVYDADTINNSGSIVAATFDGLFVDENKMQLEDWETIESHSSNVVFKKVLELGGIVYAAANDGLYAIYPDDGYSIKKIVSGKDVKAMCISGKMLFAMMSSGSEDSAVNSLYTINEYGDIDDITSKVLNFSTMSNLDVTCMDIYNGYVFIGTNRGLYYFTYSQVILFNKLDAVGNISIIDMCTTSNGIVVATTSRYYILSDKQYTEEETNNIKSFSLVEAGGYKVVDNILKIFELDNKQYAVSTEGLIDLSNYSKTIIGGEVKDAILVDFGITRAIFVASTDGIFAYTLDSDNILTQLVISQENKDVVQFVDSEDVLYCISPSHVYIYTKDTLLEADMQSSTSNGEFGSSTFADEKLYSIGHSSKLSAYNCCTDLARDTGALSAANIRDLQFISDPEESAVVSLVLIGDKLSAELLSADIENEITSINHKQLLGGEANAVKVLDDLDNGMYKLYVGTSSGCLLSCVDYNLDGSVYTQLTSTAAIYEKNRKEVLSRPTFSFSTCDRGSNNAMLIGASDGIYVQQTTNAVSVVGNDSAIHLGVMHWKDDIDQTTVSDDVDTWNNVKIQLYASNLSDIEFVTGARFAFQYKKNQNNTSNILTAYYQGFKNGLSTISYVSFDAPAANIVDAFTYYSDLYNGINQKSDGSEAYQADNSSPWARTYYYLYLVDDTGNIWRKDKDTNLHSRSVDYMLGKSFQKVASDNTSTLNADITPGLNPFVMTVHPQSFTFYKIDDIVISSNNEAQLNYYGQLAPASSNYSIKTKHQLSINSILLPSETIEKAFFGDGPEFYYPDAFDDDNNEDDNNNNEEENPDFYTDINGDYTLYVKTNQRVFSMQVNLQFNNNTIIASTVPNSVNVIYESRQVQNIAIFDKKHTVYNPYNVIICKNNSTLRELVTGRLLFTDTSEYKVVDVYPSVWCDNWLSFEIPFYFTTANKQCYLGGAEHLSEAVKLLGCTSEVKSIAYSKAADTMLFVCNSKLYAVNNYDGNLDNIQYQSTIVGNESQFAVSGSPTDLVGCYTDGLNAYCYSSKKLYKYKFKADSSTQIVVDADTKQLVSDCTSQELSIAFLDDSYQDAMSISEDNEENINACEYYLDKSLDGYTQPMVFTSNNEGIWLFSNNKKLIQVPSTAGFPASYTYSSLFTANGLLGGVSGKKIVLDTDDSSTSSYTLPVEPTRFYYDDVNDQSYVYDPINGNRYGDNIYASTYIPKVNDKDLQINSASKLDGKKVLCTSTGMYSLEMYVNKKLNSSSVTYKNKNVVSLNGSKGSTFNIIYNKNNDGLLGIAKYNLNTSIEEDIQLSAKITANAYNDKGEVSAQMELIFPVYPLFAWYVNKTNKNSLYCQLCCTNDVIDAIQHAFPEGYEADVSQLTCVNYGSKLLSYYKDISFATDFNNTQSINKINNEIYVCREGAIDKFSGYKTLPCLVHLLDTKEYDARSLMQSYDNKLLVNTLSGVCIYNDYFIQGREFRADALSKFLSSNASQKYICASGRQLYISDNYKLWQQLFTMPAQCSSLNDILVYDDKTYCFASDIGLYCTKYQFTMEHDVKAFTQDQALSLYDGLMQQPVTGISAIVSSALSNHLSTEHLSSALISHLNSDFASSKLEDLDARWQQAQNEPSALVIKNDIVAEMQFGKWSDGDITVKTSNFLSKNEYGEVIPLEPTDITYIMKRWMSGVTELYINIPTTNTYYLANAYGAADCVRDPHDSYIRPNLTEFPEYLRAQPSDLSSQWTSISVGVASAEYRIDNMLDLQINGNSLPLKIYKEDSVGAASQMYRSMIQPSVAKRYDLTKTDEDGNYIFEFAAYGTDAQAVKLMFFDKNARSGSETVIVNFDANGGEGEMSKQKFIISKDSEGYPVLEQKNLKKCRFKNTSAGYEKIFAGWSIYPKLENEEADYENSQVFPNAMQWRQLSAELQWADPEELLKNKDQITLYAVWMTYQFSETDTTLVFQSDMSELGIDSVGINEATKLKDKVIVNWGD